MTHCGRFVYHFGPEGLTVAAKTIEQFVAPAIRLYEQEPGEPFGSSRFGLYVRRWVRWAGAGLPITVKLETKALRQCCEGRTSGLPCQPNVFVPPSPDKTIPNHRIAGDIIGQALTRPRLRNPISWGLVLKGGGYGGFARMLQTTVTVQNMMLCRSVRCGGPLARRLARLRGKPVLGWVTVEISLQGLVRYKSKLEGS